MAEPKEDMFLDDPESIEAEIEAALADEDPIDITADPGLTELELLQAERDELKDRLLRTLAESENVRKRADRDRREGEQYVIEGVELTLRELLNVFAKHGMSPVVPDIGDAFNPQEHEAMFEAPLPGTKKGEIIQVMAVGLMLHERLLRPAQVGVSSNPGA